MSIDEIIKILENRLTFCAQQREAAQNCGNLSAVQSFDEEISSTTISLNQIRSLVF